VRQENARPYPKDETRVGAATAEQAPHLLFIAREFQRPSSEEDIGAREGVDETAAIDSICAQRRSEAPEAFAEEDIRAGEESEASEETDANDSGEEITSRDRLGSCSGDLGTCSVEQPSSDSPRADGRLGYCRTDNDRGAPAI
jgi:hypothetical protein